MNTKVKIPLIHEHTFKLRSSIEHFIDVLSHDGLNLSDVFLQLAARLNKYKHMIHAVIIGMIA